MNAKSSFSSICTWLMVLACSCLSACGGGGGSSSSPPASPAPAPVPTVSLNATSNQVILNWAPVPEATYYTITKDTTGSAGYSQICQSNAPTATTCNDTYSTITDFISANYKVAACNSGGCTESIPVASFTTQAIQYLKASNTNTIDQFGASVALSTDGRTLAVGAIHESSNAIGINGNQTDNSAVNSGAVYVFTRTGTTWSQQAYLKASNTNAGDQFGVSLAMSGDGSTLVVGATGEASNALGVNGNQADNSAVNSGAVYVFTRTGTTWSQQAYLKASNTSAGDQFGASVTLNTDGSTVAVGAWGEASNATSVNGNQADNSAAFAGAAYVFTRSGTTWSQQAYLKASNTDAGDQFGSSLTLSGDGNTLAVGALDEASSATGINSNQLDNSAAFAGAVYVFTRSGTTWGQQAYLKASNTDSYDEFGTSVILSSDGSTLAVGAIGESSNATGSTGNQTDNSAVNSGAVYMFTRSGTTWSQQTYLKATNANANDEFGTAVALSSDGSTLAVSATGESSNATGINGNQADNNAAFAGAAYVFKRSGTTWSQQAYLKASNTNADDEFGTSVALSSDGITLAVGGIYEAGNATGSNGNQMDNSAADAGAVYVY